jgi:DNA-directed RNA polymerase subunit E'
MFYEVEAKTHVRVSPSLLDKDTKTAIIEKLNEDFEGFISQEAGFIVAITNVTEIGEGIIVAGDGAPYYETKFTFLTFIPEMQEVVLGSVTDITNFGAFLNLGAVEGMVHVSQTMDDFVSLSKQKTLSGKQSKQVLKVKDKCRARIIALSYKDLGNPKVGLTMRQPGLGNIKWLEEQAKKGK